MSIGPHARRRIRASRLQRRVGRLAAVVAAVLVAGVAWQIGRLFYLDVRLRQELATLAQMPCTQAGHDPATTEPDARRLAETYGLSADSVTIRRMSDCVVTIDVDGERVLDLVVVQVPWNVQFTIVSK